MRTPTVGTIVWYRSPDCDAPLPAIVTYVHMERTLNLFVFDIPGSTMHQLRVPLRQAGDPIPPDGRYAELIPGESGQEAKRQRTDNALSSDQERQFKRFCENMVKKMAALLC